MKYIIEDTHNLNACIRIPLIAWLVKNEVHGYWNTGINSNNSNIDCLSKARKILKLINKFPLHKNHYKITEAK